MPAGRPTQQAPSIYEYRRVKSIADVLAVSKTPDELQRAIEVYCNSWDVEQGETIVQSLQNMARHALNHAKAQNEVSNV